MPGYVALNPPPAAQGGMKVRMGGLEELVEALQTNPEDDLFGIGSWIEQVNNTD